MSDHAVTYSAVSFEYPDAAARPVAGRRAGRGGRDPARGRFLGVREVDTAACRERARAARQRRAVLGGTSSSFGRSTRTHRPRDLADVIGFVHQDPEAQFVVDHVERDLAFAAREPRPRSADDAAPRGGGARRPRDRSPARTASRARSRAVSVNAARSPARSQPRPRRSCSTSRPRSSIPRVPTTCSRPSGASTPTWGRRSCSPSTGSSGRHHWPTGRWIRRRRFGRPDPRRRAPGARRLRRRAPVTHLGPAARLGAAAAHRPREARRLAARAEAPSVAGAGGPTRCPAPTGEVLLDATGSTVELGGAPCWQVSRCRPGGRGRRGARPQRRGQDHVARALGRLLAPRSGSI